MCQQPGYFNWVGHLAINQCRHCLFHFTSWPFFSTCFASQIRKLACPLLHYLFSTNPDTETWLSQNALQTYLLKMLVKIRAPSLAKPKVTAGFTLRFCWSLILPAGSQLRFSAFLPGHPSKQLPGLSAWHWSWFFWLLAFLDLTRPHSRAHVDPNW